LIVSATYLNKTKFKGMKNKQIIGVDISKNTLDIFLLKINHHFQVTNDPKGFVKLLEECYFKLSKDKTTFHFYFENTGRYSKQLSVFLKEAQISFTILDALDLKRSMGLTRGKSDKKDARVIAQYAWRKRDELKCTILSTPVIDQLKTLLSHREKLIKHRTSYKNSGQELFDCYFENEYEFILKSQQRMLDQLNIEIKNVEEEIQRLIKSQFEMKKNYDLLMSIIGIGKVLAAYLVTITENFTKFNDPKKFACFAGIAPFEYSSGTSVKGRTKVHSCANKQIKSLLNMAAMASIQVNGEYKTYYNRRLEEGKNKMSTLNIIRNKLVFRAFAVTKRGTPYVDLSRFAA
jgi:transposase